MSDEAKPTGRLIVLSDEKRSVSGEGQRAVLAALFRTLVHRREPGPEAIRHVLQLTCERLRRTLEVEGAFLLQYAPDSSKRRAWLRNHPEGDLYFGTERYPDWSAI